ncbi:hypothetical protein F4677DRAFT_418942 [Hypoxylon crocopeplum]|nr:hypothetical protein F4677DRAFT_418942 [Hypoxylon crocopeplum]
MKGQQPADVLAERKSADGEASMKEIWAAAAKAFEDICGESLQRGDVKGFDDVQRKIEGVGKATYGIDAGQEDKWDKAKSVGLKSLKYLKLLVGAASQASSFIPIPASAANIASSALCIVFDIPEAIKGYNDAVDQVFSEVSSALSQFQIYTSMKNVNPVLIQKIHLVMISFVKLCAHVVKYRQGRRRDRLLRQIKSIFDEDSGLGDEMAEFKRALQQQRDVEGTVTLAVVAETQHDVAILLEQSIVFGKTTEETHQLVQETQKDVQSFKDDADRSKTLIKIRDTLGVPATVRLDANTTQTCTNIYDRCLSRTGSWIWTHDAYTAWIAPNKDKETSHVLILSGPPSSGKTSASALITKRLEEQKGRTYVAHYFFPASMKKSSDEKTPVHSALKYMAFQIARVDATVQKPLGKACDAGPGVFRRSASLETLDTLWGELKIGTPGSGATYYLVFDGLENLPDKQTDMLLKLVFGPKLAEESAGRVRVLVSGTDDQFASRPGSARTSSALRIQMEEHNEPDMRIVIDEALTKRSMLEHAKPGSDQQKAREKIVEKLPQNVSGSYSRLQFGLDDVIRLLSTRTAVRELDRMLDQPTSSHEAAIKNLQRSLTVDEISELNELLKWVLFCNEPMTLDQLEAAMFLYSGTESLASLQFIIKNKYSAVLKLEDGFVYGQDGVKDYLQKDKGISGKSSLSRDRSTISMTITINNVDQELCGHFLWDLAHKAIRDKFKFDFDAASPNGALHSSNQAAITVDEFEAHHTIVTRAFEYLDKEHRDQTNKIGGYLVGLLPYHLGQVRQLEDEEKGALTPGEQFEIGQSLYKLFKDERVILRHKASFEKTWWFVNEMEDVQKWLMDSAVVRRLDKKWRDEVQLSVSPTKGFLKELVKIVIEGLLRKRSWGAMNAYGWIEQFMGLDRKLQQPPKLPKADDAESSEPTSTSFFGSADEIDWDLVGAWCQSFLGLPDSELNSLWYERLAFASALQCCKADTVLLLYERAIEKENPSWLCHRGLGETHFSRGQTQEAIAHIELALKEAGREGATPKPEANEIVELHLLLGQYAYGAGDAQRAAEHYLLARESEDPAQARQGQLGYLKAGLSFPDAEGTRQLLKSTLAKEGEEGTIVGVLKMIARDTQHDALVSRMFTVAKGDPDLLRGIVRAMEAATATPALDEDRTAEMTEDSLFAEDEARGVLLYDRGVAAYTYKVSSDGTEAVGEALRLWRESRDLLSNVGGRNALVTRQDATTALAQHYFQSMVDGNHLDHVGALARLAEADSDVYFGDAVGFLGTVYALRGKKEQAREALVRRVRQALLILSDDMPENDMFGFSIVEKALAQYQDLENAAISLSLLGQPDLVTNALQFEAKDIVGDDGVDKEQLLDTVTKLARETVRVAKAQVPDVSQQIQRIEAAKAHVDSLVAAAGTKPKPETNGEHSEVEGSENQDGQGELTVSELETASAQSLLHSRLSTLQQTHSPQIDSTVIQWCWTCDGRTPDGKHCENKSDFGIEFYHCMYCSNRDFCGDCLARLRAPDSGARITACSATHRWLRVPPQGDAMYVGLRAKTAPVPKEVRPMEDDESILEICYDENGGREITVEAWKEALAREWDISLDEIRKEVFRQATPEGGEQGEERNEEQTGGEKSEVVLG